jgi:hypothetical protein
VSFAYQVLHQVVPDEASGSRHQHVLLHLRSSIRYCKPSKYLTVAAKSGASAERHIFS